MARKQTIQTVDETGTIVEHTVDVVDFDPTNPPEFDALNGETEETSVSVIGKRIRFHKEAYALLREMEKQSGIEMDTIVDMALQALVDVDEENLTLYFQIASARRAVKLSGLKLRG